MSWPSVVAEMTVVVADAEVRIVEARMVVDAEVGEARFAEAEAVLAANVVVAPAWLGCCGSTKSEPRSI